MKKGQPDSDLLKKRLQSGITENYARSEAAFFAEKGAKKKLMKKKAPGRVLPVAAGGRAGHERGFRPRRQATEATRLGRRRLSKKAGENF